MGRELPSTPNSSQYHLIRMESSGLSTRSQESTPKWRSWAHSILVLYLFVFIAGILWLSWIFTTTSDPSLFASGLTGGFVFLGLSIFAVATYPAFRIDAATVRNRSEWNPSFRLYLGVCLGIPLGLGLVFELASGQAGSSLAAPGLMTVFVAVMLHPVVVFIAIVGYLIQRRCRFR